MECGECNNRDPVLVFHPPTLLSRSAGGGSRRLAGWAGSGMGLVGSSPCFPGAPAREEEDSQGCLGTLGAARVGAQGEGRELLKNSVNQTKALGAGRGSSSHQVLPAS